MPAYLIVNADDLGMSEGVNRAILDAHAHGIVTSASLLTVGPAFEEAARAARAHPALGVGVHLCLHNERPALDPGAIPTLAGVDGRLHPLGLVVRRLLGGRLAAPEIEAEYAAQVARAREAGIEVTHLDSHCHLHALPSLAGIVRRVARRFGIRCVRRPEALRWSDYAGSPVGRYGAAAMITLCSRLSRRGAELRAPDRFAGLVRSGTIDAAWVERMIESLEPGTVTELMVHPGDGSYDAGASAADRTYRREAEWEAVTSPAVIERVRARGVRLVDHRHLLERR